MSLCVRLCLCRSLFVCVSFFPCVCFCCWVVNDVSLAEIFIVSDTFFCIEHFTRTACVICNENRHTHTHICTVHLYIYIYMCSARERIFFYLYISFADVFYILPFVFFSPVFSRKLCIHIVNIIIILRACTFTPHRLIGVYLYYITYNIY